MEFFIGEKEKITKGNDKHEQADSLIQNNKLYPMFVPNFKILGPVVFEESLIEKKFTHTHTYTPKHTNTHTNIVTEKTKTIYLYVSCMLVGFNTTMFCGSMLDGKWS